MMEAQGKSIQYEIDNNDDLVRSACSLFAQRDTQARTHGPLHGSATERPMISHGIYESCYEAMAKLV